MSLGQAFPDLTNSTPKELAREACRILLGKLASDVKLISVEGSSLTDYYVVGYGRSHTHVRALANDLEDAFAASGIDARHREGLDSADWVLLDFGDIIVHLFGKEAGEFYRFERLFKPEAFLPLDDLVDTHNDEKE